MIQLRELTYKTVELNSLPWFDVRTFKIAFTKGEKCKGVATLRGKLPIFFEYDPTEMLLAVYYSHKGRLCSNIIAVETAETNLGIGVMYWFVCPITWRKCRKLYLYDGSIVSRFGLPGARYRLQNKTANDRVFARVDEYGEPPFRKYGKPYYRGKLTPYGKRLLRYEQRYNDAVLDEFCVLMPRVTRWGQ